MNQHRRRSFHFVASRTRLRVRNPRRYNDNCQRHFKGSGRDRFGFPRPVLRSGPRLTATVAGQSLFLCSRGRDRLS